jgi:hypothetical protein
VERHTMDTILELLKAEPQTASWVAYLESVGALEFEVTLPAAEALPAVLLQLAVPHEDIDDIVAQLPRREHSSEMWWLLERCTHALVRTMGKVDGPPPFPMLPEQIGILGSVDHRFK